MKNKISLDGGRSWKTAEEAMKEIDVRGIHSVVRDNMDDDLLHRVMCTVLPNNMPDTLDVILKEYLRLADDGLCISDPIYGRGTFETMLDDYFRDNHFSDWNSNNIKIAKNIKYDPEKRCWIARCKFNGDRNWYSVYGIENGSIWVDWTPYRSERR